MFNGIIFNKGIINRIKKRAKGVNLFIKSSLKISNKNLGISISCDGVCLTLISYKNKTLEFYLSNETLAKSKFRNIKIGDEINLEKPLKFGDNISGHICQGHVDTVCSVKSIKKVDKSNIFEFKISKYILSDSVLVNNVLLLLNFFDI